MTRDSDKMKIRRANGSYHWGTVDEAGELIESLDRENERLRGLLQRHYELRGKPAREEWVDGGPTYRLAMQLWRDTAAALAGAAVQPNAAIGCSECFRIGGHFDHCSKAVPTDGAT